MVEVTGARWEGLSLAASEVLRGSCGSVLVVGWIEHASSFSEWVEVMGVHPPPPPLHQVFGESGTNFTSAIALARTN